MFMGILRIVRASASRIRLPSAALTLAVLGVAGLAAAALAPARAQEQARVGGDVVACDSLVALRQLMARAGEDREAVPALVPREPNCRSVARAEIGAVEHRAMVGGAPYECLAVRAAPACLWVLP